MIPERDIKSVNQAINGMLTMASLWAEHLNDSTSPSERNMAQPLCHSLDLFGPKLQAVPDLIRAARRAVWGLPRRSPARRRLEEALAPFLSSESVAELLEGTE